MASPNRWKWRNKTRTKKGHGSGVNPQESCHSNSNQCYTSEHYYHGNRQHSQNNQGGSGGSNRSWGFRQNMGKPKRQHEDEHRNKSSSSSEYWKGKHRRRPPANDSYPSPSSTDEGASSTVGRVSQDVSGSSTQTQPAHIPGFYYDSEKKKYFRLLPGHNNHNPLTNGGLQLKVAEEERVQMIQGNPLSNKSTSSQIFAKKTKLVGGTQWLQLHRSRQQGLVTTLQYNRYTNEQCVRLLPLKPTREIKPFPDSYFNGEEGCITFLKIDHQQRRVLMAIQDSFLSRIWQGSITCDRKHGHVSIDNWCTVNVLGTRSAKVTNVEWASSDASGDVQVLYSMSGGATSLVQVIKCSNTASSAGFGQTWTKEVLFGCELSNEMIWTCTWNHNSQLQPQFSTGGSRKAVVWDMVTANKRVLYSGHSDVLAQVYASQQPILYNGTRRGEILGCDLRIVSSNRASMASQLKHRVCVSSILRLKDNNYLLSSDISGKVKLWDLRQCKCMHDYEGLVNKHSQLPICVDSTETVLYGAGSDKCIKFWSLQDGNLLQTLPCPVPMSAGGIPVPAYSTQWYGGATPGMIMGMERQLYWYSLTS